ncbi:MAG: glutamate ABC transporter substrate-binding protein [Micropruina sp.]|uniref:glutamate ABC transporter substrate-binding protein n=1 Tax=Micropruina sp. TaxID=2737536 RepID=UPI0039E30810
MKPGRAIRALILTAATALFAGTVAACSPEPASSGSPAPSGSSNSDAYQALIVSGPVADAAAVQGNKWASAVKQAGVLRIGGTETSELFSLLDPVSGQVKGFDAAIGQMLSRYILGEVKTSVKQVTVDTRESLLQNGNVDTVIATYSITPAREKSVDFAGPYYVSQAGILVKADNTTINGVADLAGKTVVTQANSTGVATVQKYAPEATLQPLPDNAQCVASVEQGDADAYVIDQALLLNQVVSNDKVKIAGEPFGPKDSYGIGVPKGSDGKAFVNEFLTKIIADGTWAKAWQLTIGDRTNLSTPPAAPTPGTIES